MQQVFLDKEPGSKASHASFSTRKFARVCRRQGKLDKEMKYPPRLFTYLHNTGSWKGKNGQFFYRTHEQIKPVKENLSRKTCSSYTRASELVKKTCQGKLARLYGALQCM